MHLPRSGLKNFKYVFSQAGSFDDLIKLQEFVRISCRIQVPSEIPEADDHRCCIDIGMKAYFFGFQEVLIQEHMYMILLVIDQPEGTYRAGIYTQVSAQTLLRGKGDFALLEPLFQVTDIKGVI
jgi:hypothetical protein